MLMESALIEDVFDNASRKSETVRSGPNEIGLRSAIGQYACIVLAFLE